jgi:hypothetical protein
MAQQVIPLNTAIGVAETLAQLDYLAQIQAVRKDAEEEEARVKAEIMDQIAAWQSSWPGAAFELPGGVRLRVSQNSGKSTVSSDALLRAGVDPLVVAECMVTGAPSKPFLKITKAGEPEPE